MKPTGRKKQPKAAPSRGELLVQSLTSRQLAQVLDVVFAEPETVARYGDRFEQVDADMARAVSRILDASGGESPGAPAPRMASDQKTVEYWNSLWRRWDEIVFQVGDEEGRYAAQEADWEAPYFDGYTLASDLDEVASDMEDILDQAFGLVDEPELFAQALEEIASNISSYPEWMGPGEPCYLEAHATQCVLKWVWLASQGQAHPGHSFLGSVRRLQANIDLVDLDDAAFVEFFAGLSDEVCGEIHECLKGTDYAEDRDRLYSKWHKINHLYEERFDPARHLETCRKHLDRNWHYGKPLVDDAVARGDYRAADSWLDRTFASYLGGARNSAWRPDQSLLLVERRYGWTDDAEAVAELLDCWATVSVRLGKKGIGAASRFQAAACRAPEDWQAVIRVYRKARSPDTDAVVDGLFSQWQTEMAWRSLRHELDEAALSSTWIHWLIGAALDGAAGKKPFVERLRGWLSELQSDGKMFVREWPLLARLTADLPGSDDLRKQYPAFADAVLPETEGSSKLDTARREALKKMGASICLGPALAIWSGMLRRIVPDPSAAHGSHYDMHAAWMKALYELNEQDCGRVLATWRKKHGRRRNLWRDMAGVGLPL